MGAEARSLKTGSCPSLMLGESLVGPSYRETRIGHGTIVPVLHVAVVVLACSLSYCVMMSFSSSIGILEYLMISAKGFGGLIASAFCRGWNIPCLATCSSSRNLMQRG